jgi:hypothetical protein
MANGDIQNSVASDYLDQFDQPLSVSAITKLQSFAFIQQLTYNGILASLAANVHGLQDWYDQMTIYSSTNLLLDNAWDSIKDIALKNLELQKQIYDDADLGRVGLLFQSIDNFGSVFTVTPDDDTDSIGEKASNF